MDHLVSENLQNYGNCLLGDRFESINRNIFINIYRIFSYRYKRTYEYKIRDELEKKGIEMKQPEEITLEQEYEKLEKVCRLVYIETVDRNLL